MGCVRYNALVGAPLAAPENIENARALTKHPPPAGGTLFTKETKEWRNKMQEIIIDPEFKKLLPELDSETLAWLEESLLEYGCMNPLVLWNNILIDGHNRYEIIKKHDLPFNTISMEFDSRDDVIIWIISTQISRRNLNQIQLSFFRGLHYITSRRMHGGNRFTQSQPKGHSDPLVDLGNTAVRLAEEYNVSPKTIKRDSQFAAAINAIGEISHDAKRKILSGSAGITRKHIRKLAQGAEDDIREVAESIENGTFERKVFARDEPQGIDFSNRPANTEDNPLSESIIKIADEFFASLRKLSEKSDTKELKSALRTHIDMLEEFYRQM